MEVPNSKRTIRFVVKGGKGDSSTPTSPTSSQQQQPNSNNSSSMVAPDMVKESNTTQTPPQPIAPSTPPQKSPYSNAINLIDTDINMADDNMSNNSNNSSGGTSTTSTTSTTTTTVPPRRVGPPLPHPNSHQQQNVNSSQQQQDDMMDDEDDFEDDAEQDLDSSADDIEDSRKQRSNRPRSRQSLSPGSGTPLSTSSNAQDDKSTRQTKRPRKYVDEEEDGQQSTQPPTAGTPTAEKIQKMGQGDIIQSNGRGRPKKQSYLTANDDNDTSNDTIDPNDPNADEKKKGKYKSKKSQPNNLDIRPCWFAGCTKADRSLKILRPCLIPTCKTHAIKSESRVYDALGKGFCLEENGQKDTVCGICGDSNKPLFHCANDDCAFAYCPSCTDIIVSKHNNVPGKPGWVCWVCNAVKARGKDRERTRWVKEVVQPNAFNQPRKPRLPKTPSGEGTPSQQSGEVGANGTPSLTGKRQRKNKQNMAGMEGDAYDLSGSSTPGTLSVNAMNNNNNNNNNGGIVNVQAKRGRKKMYPIEGGEMTSVPASPDANGDGEFIYHSIMSPERDPISPIDFFIDAAFNSVKFYSTLLKNQEELAEQFNGLVGMISRLRTIRWSNDYQMVWTAIEELGNLLKRNLESSQTILGMQGEIRALTDGTIRDSNNNMRNLPLERAISRVFEHHELSNRIEKECSATRNVLVIGIDGALKEVEQMHANLKKTMEQDYLNEQRITKELVELEKSLGSSTVEVARLKQQEEELVEHLSKVRNQLTTFDALRDSLTKRCSDLKIEALLSKNNVAERELDVKVKEATLENEMSALHSLINLIEGIFWGHEYFYSTEIGECEKAIGDKLMLLKDKMNYKNDIPLAVTLKSGVQIQSIKEIATSSEGADKELAEAAAATGEEDEVVTFVNPFKTLCIYHTACMDHNVPEFHLEKPDRIRVAINTINDFVNRYPGIVEVFNTPAEVEQRYVMAVHDAHYIKKLETSLPPENSDYETHLESDNNGATITVTQKEGDDDQEIYDTFVSHRSMKAALRAAGGVCAAVDAVSKFGYHRTFCAIRPPGHHAGRYGRTSDAPSQGYCLINNVAIGAKYASLMFGYTRIAVVDFDVHHGNGTQEILSGDDNFLFVSIHVCDEKRYFYPGTGRDVGEMRDDGSSEGNILNIGLKRNSGSNTFLQAWTKKIIPRLEAYQPQLIFLSAGFDGHKDDPTNGLKLTEDDYYTITKMIKEVAARHSRGRVISVLEGGYGIERSNSLQRCLNMHLKALIEDTNTEILFNQAASGDFSLAKKLYSGSNTSTIRDPSRMGDIETLHLYNTISKEYTDNISSRPQPSSAPSSPAQADPPITTSTTTTSPIILSSKSIDESMIPMANNNNGSKSTSSPSIITSIDRDMADDESSTTNNNSSNALNDTATLIPSSPLSSTSIKTTTPINNSSNNNNTNTPTTPPLIIQTSAPSQPSSTDKKPMVNINNEQQVTSNLTNDSSPSPSPANTKPTVNSDTANNSSSMTSQTDQQNLESDKKKSGFFSFFK